MIPCTGIRKAASSTTTTPPYCYLLHYIFCGRHLLAARLRPSNIDGAAGSVEEVERIVSQIRRRWSKVRALLRADTGFCREALRAWCEDNSVDFVLGLARNDRLLAQIGAQMQDAEGQARRTERPARRFKDFMWTTLNSWSCRRRVVAKAEWTHGGSKPRFIVTSLSPK